MSVKSRDPKNRFRSKTVAFRVSPEEWAHFESIVKLSGLSKQDYLIERIYDRDIVVQGNPRVYKALRNELSSVLEQLMRLEKVSSEEEELLETIRIVALTLNGFQG